jgi:hypothetical protein
MDVIIMYKFAILMLLFLLPAMAKEGGDLFVELKCVKCHTVSSQQIQTTSDKDPSEIVDLSNVGAKHDEAFLLGYLKKEIMQNDKKHKMKFKGDDVQMAAIVAWLLTLKEE